MGKFLMIVQGQAKPGHEGDLQQWYDSVHFPEMCAIPGIKSARRFTATEDSPVQPDNPNLAIYEVEADDFAAVTAELRRRTIDGEMTRSDILDRKQTRMFYFELQSQFP